MKFRGLVFFYRTACTGFTLSRPDNDGLVNDRMMQTIVLHPFCYWKKKKNV
jgi:hypothetical protein